MFGRGKWTIPQMIRHFRNSKVLKEPKVKYITKQANNYVFKRYIHVYNHWGFFKRKIKENFEKYYS